MGKFDFDIPDDFLRQLGKLSDVDKIAPKMINEAMPILAENTKKNWQSIKELAICLTVSGRRKRGKEKMGPTLLW